MTKMTTALLAIALSVPAAAFAQSSMTQQDTQAQQAKANQAAENDVNGMNTSPHEMMTGMVSADGKTITSSDNVVHQVSNPNALKNYVGQNVSVKYQFNTDNNNIKITKVNPGQ
jgi:hypothetical protein